uniref:Uncharacterized protein n=1 Tax=Romanomermis culicivorax TaxID=13658 RepID=A0A915IFG2_ROMCU
MAAINRNRDKNNRKEDKEESIELKDTTGKVQLATDTNTTESCFVNTNICLVRNKASDIEELRLNKLQEEDAQLLKIWNNLENDGKNALTLIQQQIEIAQNKNKFQYDKNVTNIAYKVGDLVLKESQVVKRGLARKLMPLYQGPYPIKKIVLPNILIELLDNPSTIEMVHVNRTKPYHQNEIS